ncbi:MAG: T9SS type A sorting domain-containing protein [Bacteroidota bacterium]
MAIRGMEMQGGTHNISHYISFDAPHKGANVPLGFQAFLHGANRIQPVRNLAEEDFDEALAQITAPAAKQLLLQYYEVNGLGNPIGDERAPHPNFIAMQSELDRIGFPSQGGIRNLAIVNGALNGSAASNRVRATTPGERILDLEDTYDAWLALLKFEGKVRTNHFNRSTQLMHFEIKGIGIRLNSAELNLDLGNVNYDLGAGGLVDDELVLEEIEDIDDLRLVGNGFRNFSFVPLFSSLASTRNITNQTELNRSYAFLDNRGQIPFDEAFGRNENTEHINAADVAGQWNDLLRLELGLNTVTTCNQIPTMNIAPPTPRSNAPFFYTCQNSGGDVTFFVADYPDPFGNQYVHSWRASGPRTLTGNGNTFTMRSTLPAGVYTVRLTRSFSTETIEDLPSNSRNRVRSSSSSRAFSVLTSSNRICSGGGGPGPGPGGGIPLTINLEDFDMEGKGEIVVWPNPTNEIINVSYKVGEESEVSVSLLSINGGYGAISLGSKSRLPGEYTDSFDVGQVAVGVYVLVVDINGDGMEKKIIIN